MGCLLHRVLELFLVLFLFLLCGSGRDPRPVQTLRSSASFPDAYLHQILCLNKARLLPQLTPAVTSQTRASERA